MTKGNTMNDMAFGMSTRQPPSKLQAEHSLLGAILANNRAFEAVADFLLPEHFSDPVNGAIYERISERILDGYTADALMLKQDFEQTGVLDSVGGIKYLAQLLVANVGQSVAGEYGRAIQDAWLRRQLVEIGDEIVSNAYGADPRSNGKKQIEAAEQALSELTGDSGSHSVLVTVGTAVAQAIEQAEAVYRGGRSPALMTGFQPFDNGLGGLWPRTLLLLGGVPGAGKTALAMMISYLVALREYDDALARGTPEPIAAKAPGVAFFSLEMSGEELGLRLTAWRAGMSMQDLREGRLDEFSAVRLIETRRESASLPLRIHDCHTMSYALLGAKVRMHLRRQPERLVVIDHLLAAEGDSGGKSSANAGVGAAMVAKATRDLRQVARDLNVPILLLTHVSREAGKRPNTRPTQADVKWGGEGDADVVCFVHRPEMFMDRDDPKRSERETEERYRQRCGEHHTELESSAGLAEFVVAKNRQGPTGVHKMKFHGPTTSFSEWGI